MRFQIPAAPVATAFAFALLAGPLAAQTSCPDAAGSDFLGGGTAGSAGVPNLGFEGSPIVGKPFRMRVSGARPNAHGCVGFSAFETPLAIPFFGATVHPGFPLFALELFVTDGEGRSPVVLDVPVVDASLCGITFVAQGMVEDPLGPGGTTFTAGRRITIGGEPAFPLFPLQTFGTSGQVRDVDLGDFDGDGLLDVLAATSPTGLAVHLGRGDGTFDAPLVSLASEEPIRVRAIELNFDGQLDAVVACSTNNDVVVLLGNGDGTFQAPQAVQVTGAVSDFALADLDNDGVVDLAIAIRSQDRVAVRFGDRTGGFGPSSSYPVGDAPETILAGDLDGDGFQELVTGNNGSNDCTVLVNRGNGLFVVGETVDTNLEPTSVLLGDVTGDGAPDLLVGFAIFPTSQVRLWRGNGDATFADPVTVAVDVLQRQRLRDMDQDGLLDLVGFGVLVGRPHVAIALGDGTGGFDVAEAFGVFRPMADVEVGDLNGDGELDLLAGEFGGSGGHADLVTVMGLTGGRLLAAPTVLNVPLEPRGIATGDVDRDGVQDVVVASIEPIGAALVRGAVDGHFGPAEPIAAGPFCTDADLADLDGDGLLDLVLAAVDADGVRVLMGDGAGGFGAPVAFAAGNGPFAVVARDLDADGIVDLVTVNGTSDDISILYGLGGGDFAAQVVVSLGQDPGNLAIGDATGDGVLDLVVTRRNSDTCLVLEGGAGGFTAGQIVATPEEPEDVVLADIDGDGDLDLLVRCERELAVRFQTAAGVFDAGYDLELGSVTSGRERQLAVGDLNGDTHVDLAYPGSQYGDLVTGGDSVTVRLGDGTGQFLEPLRFLVQDNPVALAIADVDGDGIGDLLSAEREKDTLQLSLGRLLRDAADGPSAP